MTVKTFFARIVGLCPLLDGLRVEVSGDELHGCLEEIVRFSGAPVERGLWIHSSNLEVLVDVTDDDLATDNPFGSFIDSATWADGEGIVVASRYLHATHINIRNARNNKTLIDQTFWGEKSWKAYEVFQKAQLIPGYEPLDFAFEIKEI